MPSRQRPLTSSRIQKSRLNSTSPPNKRIRSIRSSGDFISTNASPSSSRITTKQGRLSLEAYVSNVFYDVFVQDQDDTAETVYQRNWSRNIKELGNGQSLDFETFRTFLFGIRHKISDRILISQSAITSPSDSSGITGQVAHTSHVSAFQDGKKIKITIVAVLKIILEEEKRKIIMESFILESTFQPVPTEVKMTIKAQVSNAFHGILIQDQEDVFDLTYERNWSRAVVENENGIPLNFKTFRGFLEQIRAEISNRSLISEEVIVGDFNDEDNSAQVAHKPTFRGVRNIDGKLVQVRIVAVASSAVDGKKSKIVEENETPKVQIESLVLVVDEVEQE